jgi:hypothetical protein
MKGFVQGADRQQMTLLPECLDDWVDESNPVTVTGEIDDVPALSRDQRPKPQGTSPGGSGWIVQTVHWRELACTCQVPSDDWMKPYLTERQYEIPR